MPYSALRRGRVSLCDQIYLLTTVTHRRNPLFVELEVGRIVVRALRAQDLGGRTKTLAFVVMPDHVHWLVQLIGRHELCAIIRAVKGSTARDINERDGHNSTVWQPSFHDHAVRKEEEIRDVARYVICNPVRAGLVRSVREYSLWDAAWL